MARIGQSKTIDTERHKFKKTSIGNSSNSTRMKKRDKKRGVKKYRGQGK